MDAKQKTIASHINEWEPQGIDHLISPHTNFLRELIEFYWNEKASGKEMAFPHILLHSTRDGLGRSCIARLLSSELGLTFVEKVGYWLSRNGDELAPLFESRNTLLFLETNRYGLSTQSVNLILQLLHNPQEVFFKDLFADASQKIEVSPDFTLILSTENPTLWDTFHDRFPFVLRFTETMYRPEEIKAILDQRIKALNWQITEAATKHILAYAHLSPCTLMQLLQYAWIAARAANKFEITLDQVKQARYRLTHTGTGRLRQKNTEAE
jgi:Holliday junction resolvasome RuvABC ATP-dependent DNA helicase subunit